MPEVFGTDMNQRFVPFLTHRITVFVLLFWISLFLGDGKQTPIDLYWALATVATIPLWEGYQKPKWGLSTLLWILLLISATISSIVSWAPGLSLSALMRLGIGFIWFERAKTIQNQELFRLLDGFSRFMIAIVPFIMLVLVFPTVGSLLPPMNLLFAPAGHVPAAYIAIPLLPLVYAWARRKNTRLEWMAVGATILTILLSFSRGAYTLLGVFLIGTVPWLKKQGRVVQSISVGGALMLAAFIMFSSLRLYSPHFPLARYLTKDHIRVDARLSYIQEAWEGWKRAPIFGTGPSSFLLVSRQFTSSPETVAVSAHNVIAQTLVEYGMVGFLLFAGIVILSAHRARTLIATKKRVALLRTSFLASVLFTLALGLVEQSIDRYAVWLLLVISLGVLAQGEKRIRRVPIGIATGLVLLCIGVYGASLLMSDTIQSWSPAWSWRLSPYHKGRALKMLIHLPSPATSFERQLLARLFAKDAQVAAALAARSPSPEEAKHWYLMAVTSDPTNWPLEQEYLLFLFREGDSLTLCQEVRRFTNIPALPCNDREFALIVAGGNFTEALRALATSLGKAKFLYTLGLGYLSRHDQRVAMLLWEKAKDAAPDWGYFHIELASLAASYHKDPDAAIPYLHACLANPLVRKGCQDVLAHPELLPPPGSLKAHIDAIPLFLEPAL